MMRLPSTSHITSQYLKRIEVLNSRGRLTKTCVQSWLWLHNMDNGVDMSIIPY